MKASLSGSAPKIALGLALAGALVVGLARTAPAADPLPNAPAGMPVTADAPPPSASPATSAAPPAPPAPSISDWSPPEEVSAKPKPEEWDKAAPLSLLRPHARCTASAVREWVRVACRDTGDDFKGVRVVGGSSKDVHISDYKVAVEKKKSMSGVNVMFPVRRGDRRLMTIVRWESGGWKSFYIREDTSITISELWLAGDHAPAIVVH
jgi:hypothetical protein